MEQTIKQRLIEYLRFKKMGRNKFESLAGISLGYISNLKKSPGAEQLVKILTAAPDINKTWLLTGEGNMLVDYIPDTRQECVEVPLYDVDAVAGLAQLFGGGGSVLGIIRIPNMPSADGAIRVSGNSMYPLIKAGDIIAYRIVHDIRNILYGDIYILQLEHDGDTQVVLKSIKKSENLDCVQLVSYNKEYDPVDVPYSWISAIGRVTFTVTKFSLM